MPTRTRTVELKLIEGRRSDQINTDAPVAPDTAFPEPPPWFQPGAIACYHDTIRKLTELGLASEVDVDLVVNYVMAVQVCRECERQLSQRGLASRKFTTWERASRRLHALARELGLSPASRTAIRTKASAPQRGGGSEADANANLFAS
jgi:phage terminase small subunit